MATIKGKWTFNDTLVGVHDAVSNQINVEFTIQDHELDPNLYQPTFYAFSFDMVDFIQDRLCYIFASKADGSFIQYNAYTEGVWATAGGKPANKIDFGEVEQTVPDEFYTWFIANATPQEEAPTAESVKAKLQALISAANTKTSKNDTNLTDAVNTLMAGYGQGGECDGKHIIEVEELPEVGEKGVLYKIEKKDLVALSMKNEDGMVYPDYTNLLAYAFGGITVPDEYFNYAKEADTENFIQGFVYYVESEGVIYGYDDEDGWTTQAVNGVITSIDQITAESLPGVYAWVKSEYEYYEYVTESFKLVQFKADSFQYLDSIFPIVSVPTRPVETANIPTMAYYVEDEDAFLSYDGDTGEWKTFELNAGEELHVIDDISKVSEDGVYIVRSGKFVKYSNPVSTQTITEPGLYNVEDKKAVNVAYDSVCGSWKLSGTLDGLADVTTYNVKFTTVHEGNVVNCIGMRFVIELMDGSTLYYILEDGSEIQAYTMGNYNPTGSDTSTYEYVDFGKELQTVPLCFAKFIKSGTPTYDLFTTVDELPEVGENGKVYKCGDAYYEYFYGFYDIAFLYGGILQSFRDASEARGSNFVLITIPTRTMEDFTPSDTAVYYIEDENDIFVYYNGELITFGEGMNLSSSSFGGIISDISEATDASCYYAIFTSKWITYPNVSGSLNVTENGEHDVAAIEKVSVDVPNKCVFGKWDLGLNIPTNLPNTSVNFTATYDGELRNYVGIEFDYGDIQFWYVREDGGKDLPYDLGNWTYNGEKSRVVDFGSTPQTVSENFMPFLSDATPMYDLLIEVATEAEMDALLETAVIGSVYKYTGETTDTYETDALYKCTDGAPSKLVEDIEEYDGTVIITRNSEPEEPQPTLISFTIDGVEYQAEEGMTWGEWCANEEYNTDGYKLNDSNRVVSSSGTLVELGGNAVLASSSPSAGVTYMTSGVTTLTITNSDDNSESITFFVPVDITFQNLVQSEYDITNGALTIDASDNRVCYNGYGLYTQSGSYFANTYNTHTANGTFYYSSVNLISFTIDGESYTAEEGMTWTEWLANNDYNTSGFWSDTLDGTTTVIIEHTGISGYGVAYNDAFVVVGETIVSDRAYTAKYGKHTGGAN